MYIASKDPKNRYFESIAPQLIRALHRYGSLSHKQIMDLIDLDPAYKGAVFVRLDLVAQSHAKELKWSARPDLRYLEALEDDEIRAKVKDLLKTISTFAGDTKPTRFLSFESRKRPTQAVARRKTCEEAKTLNQAIAARSQEDVRRIEEAKATIQERHLTSLSRVQRTKVQIVRREDECAAIVAEMEMLRSKYEGRDDELRLHQLERKYRCLQKATKSHIDRVKGQARCFEGISMMSSQAGATEVAGAYKDLLRDISEEESQISHDSKILSGYEI